MKGGRLDILEEVKGRRKDRRNWDQNKVEEGRWKEELQSLFRMKGREQGRKGGRKEGAETSVSLFVLSRLKTDRKIFLVR